MFFMMFYQNQNIVLTMHLTMFLATSQCSTVLLSIHWLINHFHCFRKKAYMSVCKYRYKTIKLINL